MSCNWLDCILTVITLGFASNQPMTTVCKRPRASCFAVHLSVIAVFTPAQTNCVKGVNTQGLHSTELNAARVKATLDILPMS